MPHQADPVIRLWVALLILLVLPATVSGYYDLPKLPPPEKYGNLLIDRVSTASGIKPALFSHWHHRTLYTCRVCHVELDFNMKVNSTEITEEANRKGRYCGACHNGRTAFAHAGNCQRCHTGEKGSFLEKFALFSQFEFPLTDFGNRIDWVQALKRRMITPNTYLKTRSADISFDRKFLLEAEMNMIPPAVFPHRQHTAWLDCSNCHPEIFTIKKKGTKHFTMNRILKGEFCGVCHMTVAFPMDDCRRCHPGIKGKM